MSLAKKLTIDQVDFKGKRVLIRVDYNVPLDKKTNKVTDDTRIRASVPTINHILQQGARSVVLISHLGRPDGSPDPKMSLRHILPAVEKALNRKVLFVPDCVGAKVEEVCRKPAPGTVILLENVRFYLEEEGSGVDKKGKKIKADAANVANFRKSLSSLGDIYVDDAFGAAHRAHSSIVGIESPVRAAGFLMRKELHEFVKVLENPKRPLLAILGGAKVSDKIQLINNLLDKVDEMIIAGGMAYTFKKVINNVSIGKSLFDKEGAKIVEGLMKKAQAKNVKMHFPVDYVIADKMEKDAKASETDDRKGIPDGYMGLDCGPISREMFRSVIARAKTIVFNGPIGVFELPQFQEGTKDALKAIAEATKRGAVTIIGGGDTASAAQQFGVAEQVTHISTGGGASLELLEGKVLPGVKYLSDIGASQQIRSSL